MQIIDNIPTNEWNVIFRENAGSFFRLHGYVWLKHDTPKQSKIDTNKLACQVAEQSMTRKIVGLRV